MARTAGIGWENGQDRGGSWPDPARFRAWWLSPTTPLPRLRPGRFAEGITYVDSDHLSSLSDVISLHVPLMPETHHIIRR